MISFECGDCQTTLKVNTKHAGKRVKCSKCSSIAQIPNKTSTRLVFCICGGCKANFNTADSLEAKTAECPKCRKEVALPGKEQITSDESTVRFSCGKCKKAYCVPAKYAGKKFPCVKCKTACSIPKLPEPEPEPEEELALMDAESLDWDNMDDLAAGDQVVVIKKESPKDSGSIKETGPTDEAYRDPFAFNTSAHAKKKQGISKTASTKKMLTIGACVVGLYLVLPMGFLFFIGQKPPDKSTEVLRFNAHLVREASRGRLDMPTNFAEFADVVDDSMSRDTSIPSEDAVLSGNSHVMLALGGGELTDFEQKIEYTVPAFGASGYIIRSKVTSGFGGKREVIVAATESYQSFRDIQIIVNDSRGNQLASTGDLTVEQLKEQLHEFAGMNTWMSPGFFVYGFFMFTVISLLNLISWWRVLDMAGQPGWAVLVPIYGAVALARAGGRNGFIGFALALIGFIPILGLALLLYITLGVAKTFNRGIPFGVGLGFLPQIFFPVLSFSENTFD